MKKFIINTVYSILYGIYEQQIVYYRNLLYYLRKEGNWLIMWMLFFILNLNTPVLDLLYYIMFFSTLEDIVFWFCSWSTYKIYPYPVGNWYDEQLPMFRIFNLGASVEFNPYIPTFYFITISLCLIYFLFKKYQTFITIFSLIVLNPMYVIIIGSVILPKNIDNNFAFLLFCSLTSFNYSIIFYYKCIKNK